VPTILRNVQEQHVEVIEYDCTSGTLGSNPGLIDAELNQMGTNWEFANENKIEDTMVVARKWALACAFLMGADRVWYGKLLEDLKNDFTQGTNNSPLTLHQA
jgi:hypothetical protein